jgi:hypothetical protein
MVYLRRWQAAWDLARKAWRHEPDAPARRALLGLLPLAARRVVAGLRRGQ